ncbi:MAG: Auxin Efflux Carrier [Candidatus Gottesmanbacteria bacterium GW2011_GWA2_42_18]|uniref:Auxin Efflux Carrier n=1 Tax=Candidatus Gottesmanbacteria bacterium GW2011_GWA2_42_18 TaxID=1618442 RepID=A0A0G1BKC1_9BACT|nr:MAG: Auxin Efflux Carrier [Candidatus Gottesmanbacteria bacterium GW2011_GWA2_42_18]
MGFLCGKYLKAQKETLASVLIYTVTPVIIFHGVLTTELNLGIFMLPVFYFSIATLLCLSFYKLTKKIWPDNTRHILAFTAGTGNIGYFGLPVTVAVFGEKAIGIVALLILGGIFYESTLGFFITARGHHTVTESLNKLFKLPLLYAFFLGLILNMAKIPLSRIYFDTVLLFRGAYTVLGMMIVGLALSEITDFRIDFKFVSLAFLAKFFLWPLLMLLVILADINLFRLLNRDTYQIMFLLSLSPLAANTVSFATILKVQPQKAAIAVLLSTIFALIYIPLMVSIFL